MGNQESSTKPATPSKNSIPDLIGRGITYAKRKYHERRARKAQESTADRAARRTAVATVWIAISTAATVGIGITHYIVFHGQLKVMQDQLLEVQKTSEQTDAIIEIQRNQANAVITASRVLIDNQRPQLSIEQAEATAPLVFNNGARMGVKFFFKNVGKTGIEDAHYSINLFPQGAAKNRRYPGPEQTVACREAGEAAAKAKGKGFRVGTNGNEPKEWPVLAMKQSDLDKGLQRTIEKSQGRSLFGTDIFSSSISQSYVILLIAGCVDYKFASSEGRHKVQFIAYVFRVDEAGNRVPISPDDKTIKAEELRVSVSSNPLD